MAVGLAQNGLWARAGLARVDIRLISNCFGKIQQLSAGGCWQWVLCYEVLYDLGTACLLQAAVRKALLTRCRSGGGCQPGDEVITTKKVIAAGFAAAQR
jgi:hypothetical protein